MKNVFLALMIALCVAVSAFCEDPIPSSVSAKDPVLGLTWVLPGAQMTGAYYCNLVRQDDGEIGQTFTGLESLLVPFGQYRVDLNWGVLFPTATNDAGAFILTLNRNYSNSQTTGVLSAVGIKDVRFGPWISKKFDGTWDKNWLAGFKSSILFWGPKQV